MQARFEDRIDIRYLNILITTQFGGVAGSTYSIYYLAKGLIEKGHKVIFAIPQGCFLASICLDQQLPFRYVGFRNKLSSNSIREINQIIEEESIDIVNPQESRDRYNVIFSKIWFNWNAKIVLTRRQRVADNNPLKRWLHVRFSSKIVVVSHGLQQHVVKKGFPEGHTHVIHNGLPTHHYLIEKNQITALQERYGFLKDDIVIGCVARIKGKKRQDLLIKAMSTCPAHWKIMFVGIKKADFQKKWPRLSLKGIEDRVVFTGIISDKLEMIHHYTLMSANVLPSEMDGFGLVLLEAMAMGVPVIGSNFGGIPDVIKHDQNGYIFSNHNSEQLAAQIKAVVVDQSVRSRFISEGYKTALNKFSIQQTIDHYEEFFKRIIQNKDIGKREMQ
ncbi:MAG: glycosyltransferase family 4 protein [Cyclobacteriaceae bacterium]